MSEAIRLLSIFLLTVIFVALVFAAGWTLLDYLGMI